MTFVDDQAMKCLVRGGGEGQPTQLALVAKTSTYTLRRGVR